MASPNRSSLWFFGVLAILTIIATATLAIYNYEQQLKPETVQTAIALWKERGLTDYVLVYSAKKNNNPTADHYVVKVKGGKAFEVILNGSPLEERLLPKYGMHQLLQNVAEFFKCDAESGKKRVYLRGYFDAKTGAVLQYIRSDMQTRQRLEIVVESLGPN